MEIEIYIILVSKYNIISKQLINLLVCPMHQTQDQKSQISHQSHSPSHQHSNIPPQLHKPTSQKYPSQNKSTINLAQYPIHEWEASYIDQKFYLSDPVSLQKLRQLEQQIQAQKNKLVSIDTDNFNKSFLSHQHQEPGIYQKNMEVLTQINESMLIERKQNAETDLLDEEQRYRAKIQEMNKKKSELKRQIGVGTTEQNPAKLVSKQQASNSQIKDSHQTYRHHTNEQKSSQKAQSKGEGIQNFVNKSQTPKQASEHYNKSNQRPLASEKNSGFQRSQKPISKAAKSERNSSRKNQQQQPSISHQRVLIIQSEQEKQASLKSERKQIFVESSLKSKSHKSGHKSKLKSDHKSEVKSSKRSSHKSSDRGSHKCGKSCDEQKGGQLGVNLNIPEPSNKSCKIHSAFDSAVDMKSNKNSQNVKINVNYVGSEHTETKSIPHHHQPAEIKNNSDFRSQKGSHHPSTSKKSPLLNHTDKNKHEQSVRNVQQQQSIKNSSKNPSSKSKHNQNKQSVRSASIQGQQSQVKQSSSRQQHSHFDELDQRSKTNTIVSDSRVNEGTVTNQDATQNNITNQSITNQDMAVSHQDVTVDHQDRTSRNISNQDRSFTTQHEDSRISSSHQSQSQKPSEYSQSQSKYCEQEQQKSFYPTEKQSEGSYFEKKAGFIKNKKPYQGEPIQTANVSAEQVQIETKQNWNNKELTSEKVSQKQAQQSIVNQEEQKQSKEHKGEKKSSKSSNKTQKQRSYQTSKKQEKPGESQLPELDKSIKIQSEKKSRSFVIHSKQKSVKSKNKDKSSRSSRKQSEEFPNQTSKLSSPSQNQRNKLQIEKLNKEVKKLQEKLEEVEQKQKNIIKYENNQSNVMNEGECSQIESSEAMSPLKKSDLQSKLRLQHKLSLSGSTVQFNSFEEKKKASVEENEKLQKLNLQQQIGRLKKTIRDMQMQKIKSIEHDAGLAQIERKSVKLSEDVPKFNGAENQQTFKSDLQNNRKNLWISEINMANSDFGKIVKNNSPSRISCVPTPRKFNKINAERIKNFSEQNQEDVDFQHAPLPFKNRLSQSLSGRKSKELRSKEQYFNKFEQNQRNFHQFLESSRIIPQPQTHSHINMSIQSKPQQQAQSRYFPVDNSHHDIQTPKRTITEMVEKIKRQNPEDQLIASKQIQIGDLEIPKLPEPPFIDMGQQQLTQLAKQTFALFGKIVDQSNPNNQLCMKKYKNCVIFSLSGSSSECILWHYSGKFYFGGWKNNDASEGEKTGSGLEYVPGKYVYKGQFLGGKKNGTGIIKTNNGNIYDGQWVDGVKNGRGAYLEVNTKTLYNGEWKDGKRDGYGFLKFSQTEFYEGTFHKSVKDGYGIQKFANGDIFKGEYQKGRFHGQGKYIWSNGSLYDGEFVDGYRHGQGSWRSSRKAADIYVGIYQNDKKCGYGRYIWANGCVYEGNFKDDLKSGKGRLIYQDGKEIKGVWEDGHLVHSQSNRNNHEEQPLQRSTRISSFRQKPLSQRGCLL